MTSKFENKYGESPQEMHARLGVAQKCLCGRPGVGTIDSLIQEQELWTKFPAIAMALLAKNRSGPVIPSFNSKYGKLVRIARIAPCAMCFSEAEKAAAKGPSYVIIEICKGPGKNKYVTQVQAQLTPVV
jgi:hypothetical protein